MNRSRAWEWSDWLNPILVKEVRAGMRGTVFTTAFLLLHALMLFAGAVTLLSQASHADRGFLDGLFWFLIGVPLLGVLPLSGGVSLAAEQNRKTLEPMLLTHLSPSQIVTGKWLAVTVQTALLISSILPYVLLRYFLGGVDLSREVSGLLIVMVLSMTFTAVAIGCAALPLATLFRGTIALGLAWPLFAILTFLATPRGVGGGRLSFLASSALAVLLILLSLSVGARQIAPPAEARAVRVRIVTLLALLLGAFADTLAPAGREDILTAATLVIATVVAAAALCEKLPPLPGLYVRLRTGPLWRRALELFLAPGWPSGVLFALLVVAASVVVVEPSSERQWRVVIGCSAALLGPAAVLRTAFSSARRPLLVYLILQCVSFTPTLGYLFGNVARDDGLKTASWVASLFLPLSYAFLNSTGVRDDVGQEGAWVVLALAVMSALLLLTATWRALRVTVGWSSGVAREASTAVPGV